VAEAGFSTSRRGYHPDEVRAFLTSVAAELGRMKERERLLEAQLLEARAVTPDIVELDDATVAKALGEETLRVLHTARESASEIKIRAEENAARTLREAAEEANRMRQDAEVEAARKRQDASADAEAEVALAKQQGREMVNEARAYRERVLADLERRTTLARHQIEELLHGRDRLLQVFERARLVAVDVTSGLQDVDTPSELVNLAPTTGPVPVMVPQERTERTTRQIVDEVAADVEPETPVTDEADTADAMEVVTDDGTDVPTDVDETEADTAEAAADPEPEPEVVDATDELDAADEADETTAQATDANVVSLFRGRSAPVVSDDDAVSDDDSTDDDSTDDDTAAPPARDVGGIFERLRHDVVEPEASGDHVARVTDDAVVAGEAVAADDDLLPADHPTAFSRRDEVIVPLIVAAARKLKRVLADEQNGVLDTLRQREPVVDLGQLVPHEDDHAIAYLEALSDELLEASVAGARETGANDSKTLRRKLVSTGALDRAHGLVRTDLIAPLRDRLQRAITAGDGDNEAITKRVRSVYREWKTQHIDDQLDDVFRFAHGGGLFNAITVGDPVVWVIDPSEPACPDCEDNSLAGSITAGDAFPTGHSSAPAHPGCRCLTLPEPQ
jgi:DivIVA domain-containing protein